MAGGHEGLDGGMWRTDDPVVFVIHPAFLIVLLIVLMVVGLLATFLILGIMAFTKYLRQPRGT
jgi:hypothetical protein